MTGLLVVSCKLINIAFNAVPTSEPDSLVFAVAVAINADNSSICTPNSAATEAVSVVASAISFIEIAALLVM